jgi:hypothetical protein
MKSWCSRSRRRRAPARRPAVSVDLVRACRRAPAPGSYCGGFMDWRRLDMDPDFDAVRQRDDFRKLRRSDI